MATNKTINNSLNNKTIFFVVFAIILITYISFSEALKNNFINWDDNAYVFDNPHLNQSLPSAVIYFFQAHTFVGNYVPLTMIVYALQFHAAELNPQFYHLVNILIHLLNEVLVFWFIYQLSKKQILTSVVVALFFGIHPLRVESVAWISELKDVLYGFFFIAAMISYFYYLEKKNKTTSETLKSRNSLIPLALSFIFFVLSLLSKPAAVTLPLVLILLDFYTNRKLNYWAWIEKIPFIIFSVIFGVIAIKSQQADRLLHDEYDITQKLLFASHSCLDYIVKLFLPVNLSIYYPYPTLSLGTLPSEYYFAPVALIILFYLVFKSIKHSRLVAFGFLFFFVNILLVLQLISVGEAIKADRYTYIPHIGLLFIVATYLNKLYTNQKLKTYKPTIIIALIGLAFVSSYCTRERCKVWKNDITIANDLLNKFPNDRLALNNKGFILYNQQLYQESILLFTKAIQQKPNYTMAYINLSNSYLAINDLNNASNTIDTALKYVKNDFNLLTKKAYLLFLQNNYTEAIKACKRALIIKQNNVSKLKFVCWPA